AAIPVVVLTAKDLTDADRRRLNGGVARIVRKDPAGADLLVAQLRHAIAAHRARAVDNPPAPAAGPERARSED
ncbi:MAG TPA: hypothetical protein VFO14_18485, partial [Vicinamibacterales bacterium]|nr:hypothetical protein [Vicinamibacterales bacterium]